MAEDDLSWAEAWRAAEAELGAPLRKRYKGWLIAAVGALVFGGFCVIVAVADAQPPSHYVETTGLVVTEGVDAVIRFPDATGTEVRFEDFTGAREGESVSVFYDPADPAGSAETVEGRAFDAGGLFIAAAIAGVVALLCAIPAAWLFRSYRKALLNRRDQ